METNETIVSGQPNESPEPVRPRCKLVGTDGNVFSVIGNVCRALKRAGLADRAAEFSKRAFTARDYDDVLGLCFEFVDVV